MSPNAQFLADFFSFTEEKSLMGDFIFCAVKVNISELTLHRDR